MRFFFLFLIFAHPAYSDPLFMDRAAALPVQSTYGGPGYFVGGGVGVFDCNDDGLPELFTSGGESPARFYINTTPSPGAPIEFGNAELPDIIGVMGVYPIDIDSDGILDLVILMPGKELILKGAPACSFSNAPEEWGLRFRDAWSTAFTATWEKDQVFPTMVFGHYVDRADPNGPFEACDTNDLYRPTGSKYGAPEVIDPGYCTLSMLISDWQRTGTPELRISNDRHYYVRGGYEQMFRLNPLEERTEDWPKISLWGMGIASRDLNGDGLPEVMMTSMGDQLLQFNTGTGFVNAPYEIGTYAQRPFIGDDGRPSTGWHAEFGDIDNDGRDDLFIAKGNVNQMPSNAIHDPNNLLMQMPDGKFVEKALEAGVATMQRSRGAAVADLNADGLLDIVVINTRANMELWQNVTEGTGHWLEADLRQPEPNTRAVGAWIELRVGGKVVSREITVGGGHASGEALPQHFGLGAEESAEIRVIWPGGATSDWVPLPVDRVSKLMREGDGLVLVP